MVADVVKFLRGNNTYQASMIFFDNWEKFLELEAKGRNYNFFYQWNIPILIVGWLFAFAIGWLVVSNWKKLMNTALGQTHAAGYIIPGSLNFTAKNDSYLYSKTTKTRRQKSSSSSSLGGGGRSSSGRSGRGGRF